RQSTVTEHHEQAGSHPATSINPPSPLPPWSREAAATSTTHPPRSNAQGGSPPATPWVCACRRPAASGCGEL
uniref:Uncharacterized protein n=1 Tax=Leersia perrieri TaxID=77586 RepID=A0A0D9Y1E0_9ORYZ